MTNSPKPERKPLNFETVDRVRRQMLLTQGDLAQLLGVSRVTYIKWVQGNPIRVENERKARIVMRKLVRIVTEHQWPTPEVVGMDREQRYKQLLVLLGEYE